MRRIGVPPSFPCRDILRVDAVADSYARGQVASLEWARTLNALSDSAWDQGDTFGHAVYATAANKVLRELHEPKRSRVSKVEA